MSDVAGRINAALPAWARYEGYATYALSAYVYAAIMAGVGGLAYTSGYQLVAYAALAAGVLSVCVGTYYRTAAKLRVECGHCGAPAEGDDVCPECGERTYTGGHE